MHAPVVPATWRARLQRVPGEMLWRRGDLDVAVAGGVGELLDAAHPRRTVLPDVPRVLARALVVPPPPRVTVDVERGPPDAHADVPKRLAFAAHHPLMTAPFAAAALTSGGGGGGGAVNIAAPLRVVPRTVLRGDDVAHGLDHGEVPRVAEGRGRRERGGAAVFAPVEARPGKPVQPVAVKLVAREPDARAPAMRVRLHDLHLVVKRHGGGEGVQPLLGGQRHVAVLVLPGESGGAPVQRGCGGIVGRGGKGFALLSLNRPAWTS